MTCDRQSKPTTAAWMRVGLALVAVGAAAGCEEGPTSRPSPPSAQSSEAATEASEKPQSEGQVEGEQPAPQAPSQPASSNQRTRDLTFDDLKFDIEPDAPFDREMLTDEIEALVGQRIRIRGYILPTFQRSGIEQFVLVRDNQECCFGPGAALYDCVVVDMVPGTSADFSVKPVAVEGTFSIDELIGPDGKHLAIFHLDGERVN